MAFGIDLNIKKRQENIFKFSIIPWNKRACSSKRWRGFEEGRDRDRQRERKGRERRKRQRDEDRERGWGREGEREKCGRKQKNKSLLALPAPTAMVQSLWIGSLPALCSVHTTCALHLVATTATSCTNSFIFCVFCIGNGKNTINFVFRYISFSFFLRATDWLTKTLMLSRALRWWWRHTNSTALSFFINFNGMAAFKLQQWWRQCWRRKSTKSPWSRFGGLVRACFFPISFIPDAGVYYEITRFSGIYFSQFTCVVFSCELLHIITQSCSSLHCSPNHFVRRYDSSVSTTVIIIIKPVDDIDELWRTHATKWCVWHGACDMRRVRVSKNVDLVLVFRFPISFTSTVLCPPTAPLLHLEFDARLSANISWTIADIL